MDSEDSDQTKHVCFVSLAITSYVQHLTIWHLICPLDGYFQATRTRFLGDMFGSNIGMRILDRPANIEDIFQILMLM